MPGWIDNFNGPAGIIAGVAKGVVRTMLIPGLKNDIVPVDIVSKCVLVATWYRATNVASTSGTGGESRRTGDELVVCNCTSGNVNPTSFADMEKAVQETAYIYPYNGLVRRPNIRCTGSKFVHAYWQVVSHYIPAVLADGVSMLIGAKPRFVDLYRRIDSSLSTLDFFVGHEWTWTNRTFLRIRNAIPAHERDAFDFDMSAIEWDRYYRTLTLGVKMYALKDSMEDLPKAKLTIQRNRLVRWLSSILFILIVGRVFFLRSAHFRKLWFEALFKMYKWLRFLKMASLAA